MKIVKMVGNAKHLNEKITGTAFMAYGFSVTDFVQDWVDGRQPITASAWK